jgi:transcriptional regulator of acetoin/glycerol metabolism
LENSIERAVLISQGGVIRKKHIPQRIWKKNDDFGYGMMSLNQGFKQIIEATLDQCGGNISSAARELKIARSTLYRKMKDFGLS